MDTRHRLSVIGVTVAVLLTLAGPVHGDPRDDKKRVEAEVTKAGSLLESATARAQDAARNVAAAETAMPGATAKVAEATGRVAAANAEVKSAQRELVAANAARARADTGYQTARTQVTEARNRLGGFVSAAYKGSGISLLTGITRAGNPAELSERLGYLDFVVDEQRAALDQVVAARQDAKEASNIAVLAERRAAEVQWAAEAALVAAEVERLAAQQAAAEVTTLVEARKAALAIAAEEREATLARYEQVKAESARIEAELRAWEERQRNQNQGAPPGPVLRPGARLLMPAQGWKSSDFGMRYDPYYNVWQLHAGVDIAAGGGQPIYAADDGKVTRAGWNGGYGNYTCVYHGSTVGGSLATCYAHQSQVLVEPDQRVRRGQLIGRVGTTGASTGYHLHFEVRINGEPVNPLSWLPGCFC